MTCLPRAKTSTRRNRGFASVSSAWLTSSFESSRADAGLTSPIELESGKPPAPSHRRCSVHQQHDLQQDQDDDHQLEELAAGDGRLLDGKAVDVVDGLELVADVRLPLVEAEAGGSDAEYAGRIDVAGDLQRIFRAVGQLVDIDEEGVHLPGRARIPAAQPGRPPAAGLQGGIGAGEFGVEPLIVISELE